MQNMIKVSTFPEIGKLEKIFKLKSGEITRINPKYIGF
jgi:hypothetical protein